MYNVSERYRAALLQPIQKYKLQLNIDGTEIDQDDIVAGTFTMSNQCSDADTVQIGSVYTGVLKFVIAAGVIERNTWEGARIEAAEGMMVQEDPEEYEFVPLGVFFVAEANHTDSGVEIVAYDAMLDFDKDFNLATTTGAAFDILAMLCQDCGVSMAQTRAQIEAFPNGSRLLALYSENDCKYYRDALFWIAQTLGCYATINRAGALELRQYKESADQTVDKFFRYSGSSFSDFVTEYSGIAYTDIDSQEYVYISDEEQPDTKLTYNLGANPFMQYGTDSTRKEIARAILNVIKKIHYTPFTARYLNGPALDLGDVIRNRGGLGAGTLGCIMKYEYNFVKRYTAEGFGKNPALESARNKVDKDIAGLQSKIKKDSIYFYTFKNSEAKNVGDGGTAQIVNIRFTTTEAKQVTFQAEILADATVTAEQVAAQVTYYLNGDGASFTDYKPTETWTEDGKHIISLYYVIDVEPQTLYRWEAYLTAAGGSLNIPPENIRATIWGQGLVAVGTWDGYIDAEDTIGAIPLDDIQVAAFTDEAAVSVYVPEDIQAEDTIGAIPLDDIRVATFDDVAYVNKLSVYGEGLSWEDLAGMTWSELFTDWLW